MRSLIVLLFLLSSVSVQAGGDKDIPISQLLSDATVTVIINGDIETPAYARDPNYGGFTKVPFPKGENPNPHFCAFYFEAYEKRRIFRVIDGIPKKLTKHANGFEILQRLTPSAMFFIWCMGVDGDQSAPASLTTAMIESASNGLLSFTVTVPPPEIVTE